MLVGNKVDLARSVTTQEGEEFAKKNGIRFYGRKRSSSSPAW